MAALDAVTNVLFSRGQELLAPNVLRTLSFILVAYAFATTYPDYGQFATPGLRRQEHRWHVYAVGFVVLLITVVASPTPPAMLGLGAFGILSTLRLGLANAAVVRLERMGGVQRDLAGALAAAEEPLAVLQAGARACERILDLPASEGLSVSCDGLVVVRGPRPEERRPRCRRLMADWSSSPTLSLLLTSGRPSLR